MEKETQFQKIQRLSRNQQHIRNIATSAHIHHGKTALTDNLLAAQVTWLRKNAGNLEEKDGNLEHSMNRKDCDVDAAMFLWSLIITEKNI
jgi:hypothetical protein